MDVSTIASWGPDEDRPERDQMRGRLIGRKFMAYFREAKGDEQQHEYGWWFKWVRENTAIELRWMWSSDRAFKEKNTEAYAQVAGDLILRESAEGNHFTDWWFKTDIDEHYGWLFEPECLRHDGWQQYDRKNSKGRAFKCWHRPSD